MKGPANYDVEIANVREVSLLGTADLAYWQALLEPEGLVPAAARGHAEILICGSEMRYLGVLFRELIFAVFVSDDASGVARDGVFLAHAFNSFWPFALIERAVFHTPYYHGGIRIDSGLPAALRLSSGRSLLFEAAMAKELLAPRIPLRREMEIWEGPIHLPSRQPGSPGPRRLFFGKIGGPTEAFPFDAASDRLTLVPSVPILKVLLDSNYRPREWLLRPSATHGKSKTMLRSAAERLQLAAAT